MLILTIKPRSERVPDLLTHTIETFPKETDFLFKEINSKLEFFQALQAIGDTSVEQKDIYVTSKHGTKTLKYIIEHLPATNSVVRITKDPTLKTCLSFGAVLSTNIDDDALKDTVLQYGEELWTVCDFFDDDITYAIRPFIEGSRVKVYSVYDDYIVDELCPSFYYETSAAICPDRKCLGFIKNPFPAEQDIFLNTWKLLYTQTTDTETGESRTDWAFGVYDAQTGELTHISPYFFSSRICYVPYDVNPDSPVVASVLECWTLRNVIVDLFSGKSWNGYLAQIINSDSFLLTFGTAFPCWCSLVNLPDGEKMFYKLLYRLSKRYTKEYNKAIKKNRLERYRKYAIEEKLPEDFGILADTLKNTLLASFIIHVKLLALEWKIFS